MALLLRASNLDGAGLRHGFSTAEAGDAKAAAVQARLAALAGIGAPIATARQVHGTAAVWAEGAAGAEADVLLVRRGFAAGVFTADCVPILLFDPEAGLGAAVHAGWRGTVAGAATAAVAALAAAGARRERTLAAIGPHVGPCCYAVGAELAERFVAAFGEGVVRPGPRLDLGLANRRALEAAGVARIEQLPGCTACARGDGGPTFFSYRRERELSGRQLSFLAI